MGFVCSALVSLLTFSFLRCCLFLVFILRTPGDFRAPPHLHWGQVWVCSEGLLAQARGSWLTSASFSLPSEGQ